MNIRSIFNPVFGDGTTETKTSRLTVAVILLTALVVAVLVLLQGAPVLPAAPIASSTGPLLAESPELMVAARHAAAVQDQVNVNPEMGLHRRYAAGTVSVGTAEFSANPELFVARRFSSSQVNNVAGILYSANPELSAARRFSAGKIDISLLAANPELSVAQRYAASQDKSGEGIVYSGKPDWRMRP